MDNPENFRPHYHFTPRLNWMNDPNGLVFHNGVYHLFYQHNPHATYWGHMSWGHAASTDLMRWEHLPVAIWEEPEAGYTIYSGSAVIDREDTSGFGAEGAPAMVAVYTADGGSRTPPLQTVHIAYSTDEGRSFTEFDGNPVVDEGERKFGDPKVFWYVPTRRWIMVAIYGHEQGHVVLYASQDLKAWAQLSEFHAPEAAPGVWECPDLFPLRLDGDPNRIRWVLKVNSTLGPEEIPSTRHFLGDFDGERFVAEGTAGPALGSDDGAIYAEVSYNGLVDGRRVLVGWLREQPHPARPWTGAQSLPRVLTLREGSGGPELCQRPVVDVQALRGRHWALDRQPLDGVLPLEVGLSERSLELIATFDLGDAEVVGLRLALSEGVEVVVGYDVAAGELFVEPGDRARVATPYRPSGRVVMLRTFLDQAIVEAFAGEAGVDVPAGVTAFAPFGLTYEALSLFAEGGAATLRQAHVWRLSKR